VEICTPDIYLVCLPIQGVHNVHQELCGCHLNYRCVVGRYVIHSRHLCESLCDESFLVSANIPFDVILALVNPFAPNDFAVFGLLT
jgi:hypothetical protein